jgi:HEAT repeat protein
VKLLSAALADEQLMIPAVEALRSIGTPAKGCAPVLINLYSVPENKQERISIIQALGAIDPVSKGSLDLFVSCILEKDGNIRRAAIRALGRSGKSGLEYIPLLEKVIAEEEKKGPHPTLLQFSAVEAVFGIQPENKHLVAWLSGFLSDTHFGNPVTDQTNVVRDTIKMLGQIGPAAATTLPLIKSHKNYSQDSQYQAILLEAIMRIEKR